MPEKTTNHRNGYLALLNEDLLTVREAASVFPGKVTRDAVDLYVRKGVRGEKLEVMFVGGKRLTSRQAINRFLARLNGEKPAERTPRG